VIAVTGDRKIRTYPEGAVINAYQESREIGTSHVMAVIAESERQKFTPGSHPG